MKQRRSTRNQIDGEAAGAGTPLPAGPKSGAWKKKFVLFHPSTDTHYNLIVTLAFIDALVCLATETISPTAYGKFGADASIALPPQLGWWLMEIPVTLTLVYFFFIKGGSQSHEFMPRLLALVMCGHYLYRGWYYPYNIISAPGKLSSFSVLPALGGWLVTLTHGYLNAKWFAQHGKHLRRGWARDVRFWVGLVVYYSGFAMLVWHDNIMRNLRSTPGPRYRIPYGGLFDYATSAHYFVELWAWLGFAILSWGPNGLFIFFVSLFNLVPRAVSNHYWYIEKFGDEYPTDRAFLVPFVW